MKRNVGNWIIAGCCVLGLAAAAGNLRASVSIELAVGSLPGIAAGDAGLLVVDVNGDGFQTPQEGIQLAAGNYIGYSDDLILAVFQADNGGHWNGGIGFSGIASAVNLVELGIPVGAPLKFYWLPGKQPGDTTSAGETWHSFRNDAAGNSGGSIGFLTPNEFGVYRISFLTADLGGNFDSANPSNSGDYGNGPQLGAAGNLMTQILSTDSLLLSWEAAAGATEYRIYRGTSPDFASASLLQTTTDLSFTDSGLPVGQFYYWVETVFPGDSSVAGLGSPASTVLAIPNLSLRPRVVRPKKTRTGKGFGTLTNTGPGEGSFLLSGSRGNGYTKILYFRTSGGKTNITGPVKAGIYATSSLPNSAFETFLVQAKASPKYRRLVRLGKTISAGKRTYRVRLRATPDTNSVGVDSGVITFARRRP